jgi:hypothetical protein
MSKPKPIHADDGTYCPLWRKARHKVCHTCAWWTEVRGNHPQTGQRVEEWNCAIAFMPMLQIETTLSTRQAASETHELRNDVRASNDAGVANVMLGLNQQMRAVVADALPPASGPQKLLEN